MPVSQVFLEGFISFGILNNEMFRSLAGSLTCLSVTSMENKKRALKEVREPATLRVVLGCGICENFYFRGAEKIVQNSNYSRGPFVVRAHSTSRFPVKSSAEKWDVPCSGFFSEPAALVMHFAGQA